jgi:SAM-dependent methyltransferase
MNVSAFLDLLMKELEVNADLRDYYRLLNDKRRFYWRKAYLEQRLTYIDRNLQIQSGNVWDVGCGYGTTAIYLALNGYNVYGNTIEYYGKTLHRRLEYWSKYGDLSKLRVEHADIFDNPSLPAPFDAVIAQDALHHIEPVEKAMRIISSSLKEDGQILITEENGCHPYIAFRNLKHRGNQKIINYYDAKLQKTILMGNENARSLYAWQKILRNNGFVMIPRAIQFVRVLPPLFFSRRSYEVVIQLEQRMALIIPGLRDFLYFGINFKANKISRDA